MRIGLAAALALTVSAPAFASQAPTRLEAIDAEFRAGKIDEVTRAIDALLAVAAPDRLPGELAALDQPKLRCLTPIYHDVFVLKDRMSPAQWAQVASFFSRPAVPNEATVNALNNQVVVHYDAVATSAGLAQFVADAADNSWATEVDSMGWRAPLLDGGSAGEGGSVDLDIYLVPLASGGAVTAPETANAATPYADSDVFIEIDPSIPMPSIETYVAHEFNHGCQYAYDSVEADFLYESTAVFMEDKVYDADNDYVPQVGDFQSKPETTLSYVSTSDLYMYGGMVLMRYLADKYDGGNTAFVRSIWENAEQNDTNNSVTFFDALNTILPAKGLANVQAMYAEFAGYRALTGANADGTLHDASLWADVDTIATYTTDNVAGGTTSKAPMKLGGNYIAVGTASGAAGDELTFTLHETAGTGWAIATVQIPPSGPATVSVTADPAGTGSTLTAKSSDNQNYKKVIFVVSNLGVAGQQPDTSPTTGSHTADLTTSSFTYDLAYSGGAAGCGCDTTDRATAGPAYLVVLAIAAAFLLQRRRLEKDSSQRAMRIRE